MKFHATFISFLIKKAKSIFFLPLLILLNFNTYAQQNWESIGPELNRFIWTLYADTVDDLFYIGGDFSKIDTLIRRGIITWDGVSFQPLGCGVEWDCDTIPSLNDYPHPVRSITRFGNDIIIAGSFDMVDGINVNSIAKWNGVAWDSLGNGLTGISGIVGSLRCLLVEGNYLYAGGIFHIAGQDTVNGLARWDGSNWSKVGNVGDFGDFYCNSDNNIYCMAYYKDELYVGGIYRDSLDMPQKILRWDGTKWKGVGDGIVGIGTIVYAMVVYKDELYVGGLFNKANGNVGNYIQKWDGTNWSEVGSGVSLSDYHLSPVRHFHVFKDELWVTGDFDLANGVPAKYIAKWNGVQWCSIGTNNFDIPPMAINSFRDELILGNWVFEIDSIYYPGLIKWTGGTYSDSCSTPINGVVEIENSNGFSIFPNPANNILHIKYKNATLIFIEIYSISGQNLRRKKSNKNREQIDISALPPGNYFIRAISRDDVFVREFVIVK
ncbi:MAG: T9SS type A sorting domain-containing protein [Bacteroidota bacterium]|nr:T9SS type A sorting domain-containing protein [Bacteroidota bacterium]